MSKRKQDIATELLTTKQAATALFRQPQTLRRWAAYEDGPIKPVRIHGRLGWKRSDIEELVGAAVVVSPHGQRTAKITDGLDQPRAPTAAPPDSAPPARTMMSAAPIPTEPVIQPSGTVFGTAAPSPMPKAYLRWSSVLGWSMRQVYSTAKYAKGELIEDVNWPTQPYRVERILVDQDTAGRFYMLKRVDTNRELMRTADIVENLACYRPLTGK